MYNFVNVFTTQGPGYGYKKKTSDKVYCTDVVLRIFMRGIARGVHRFIICKRRRGEQPFASTNGFAGSPSF